jgi:hypothetical protein
MTATVTETKIPYLPKKCDGLDTAFGLSRISDWLPPMRDIPDEFKRHPGTKWNKMISDWFFSGAKDMVFTPVDGIDAKEAMKHIKACLASWEPQHKHKEAGCAYLLSLWFKDISYKKV